MTALRIDPVRGPLRGSVPVPDDEDVLLTRLALATLSRGTSTIETLGPLFGVARSLATALQLLGVSLEGQSTQGAQKMRLEGRGLTGALAEPGWLDARGEPRLAAHLIGLGGGRPSSLELLTDPLVAELLGPLLTEGYGARLDARTDGVAISLPRQPESFRAPGVAMESAGLVPWVKHALLLLGLRADSATLVTETIASSDHLERALVRARVPLSVQGTSLELHPPRDQDALAPDHLLPVGSMTCATALLAAGLVVPGSQVVARGVGLGPSRADALTVLRALGVDVGLSPRGDHQGEPIAEVSAWRSRAAANRSRGSLPWVLGGETTARLGDAALLLLPVIAKLGVPVTLTDLVAGGRGGDPRIFARAVGYLRGAGVPAEVDEQGIVLGARDPEKSFAPLVVTTGGDGRLALLATLLALGSDGVSEIDDVDCLGQIYPRWPGTLRALGARVEVVPAAAGMATREGARGDGVSRPNPDDECEDGE